MSLLPLPPAALAEYQAWLGTIKQRIVSVRLRMALAASRELIQFYWDLGALIAHKQAQSQWGDKLIAQLSADLQVAFPEIRGLSASNLKYCLRFFQLYRGSAGIHVKNRRNRLKSLSLLEFFHSSSLIFRPLQVGFSRTNQDRAP